MGGKDALQENRMKNVHMMRRGWNQWTERSARVPRRGARCIRLVHKRALSVSLRQRGFSEGVWTHVRVAQRLGRAPVQLSRDMHEQPPIREAISRGGRVRLQQSSESSRQSGLDPA